MVTGAFVEPSVGPFPNAASVSSTDKGFEAPIAGGCDKTMISTPMTKAMNTALSWRLSEYFSKIIVEAYHLVNHRIRFIDRETILASRGALQVHRSLMNKRCLKLLFSNHAETFPDLACRRGVVKNHDSYIIQTMKSVVKVSSEGAQFLKRGMRANCDDQSFATGRNLPLCYHLIVSAISGRKVEP